MKTFLSQEAILNRAKEALNLKNDTELSSFLGISKSTLSNWNSEARKIDYPLLFTKCEHVNYDWLLTGEGSMLRNEGKPEASGHDEPQVQSSKPNESILYNMYKDLIEEKKEKEKKIEQLTNELRAMERKVGKLEAELEHAAALGSRTADNASTRKHSSQSRASAHSASAHSNE